MAGNNKPRAVLLARFSALGDVAMCVPALYNACAANPDVRFIFLTRKFPAGMLLNPPSNLKVEGINLADWKGAAGMWRLVASMRRRYGIDTFIDLHDVLRTRLMRIASRLKGITVRRIDKGRHDKRLLTKAPPGKILHPLRPTILRYSDAIAAAGLAAGSGFTTIYGSGKAPASDFASITDPKPDNERWLAIAPFAAHEAKTYPLPMMAQVVAHYASLPGYRLFIMGAGENEESLISSLIPADSPQGKVVNMAALKAGLKAELALMSHCDTMLSMDSANMHLASLAGLRTVSIWGATHPFAGFSPWLQAESDMVMADMPCRPCSVYGNRPCRLPGAGNSFPCLMHLSPADIIARIDAGLHASSHMNR